MKGLPSFFGTVGVGFFAERAFSVIGTSAFRLPRTENAFAIGCEGFEAVLYFVLLVFSQGKSGGEDGGLDANASSEKIGLSLLIGVDDRVASDTGLDGSPAILDDSSRVECAVRRW